MVSGYPSALYDELLGQWGSVELQVMNQAGVRTEKLWFNFTQLLHKFPEFSVKRVSSACPICRRSVVIPTVQGKADMRTNLGIPHEPRCVPKRPRARSKAQAIVILSPSRWTPPAWARNRARRPR